MATELAFPCGLEARIFCSMTRQVDEFPTRYMSTSGGSRGTLDVANPDDVPSRPSGEGEIGRRDLC